MGQAGLPASGSSHLDAFPLSQWPCVHAVPGHGGGSALVLHQLPDYPQPLAGCGT